MCLTFQEPSIVLLLCCLGWQGQRKDFFGLLFSADQANLTLLNLTEIKNATRFSRSCCAVSAQKKMCTKYAIYVLKMQTECIENASKSIEVYVKSMCIM